MSDASAAADIFLQAAELNRRSSLMRGSVLHFPDYGQLVMTGDLHGHWRNFEKLQRFCNLENTPIRHVILHELIHEEPTNFTDPDMSHLLLLAAAKWKCEFPDQVHFLQSNHEMAQFTGHPITKGGRIVNQDFEAGIARTYGGEAARVLESILALLCSYPLAAETANRVFLSHSLPGERTLNQFQPLDLAQPLDPDMLGGKGTAYALVWGRHQSAELLATLAEQLDVDFFMCGHQPQENGFDVLHDRMFILASDHNHGAFLPFDLKREHSAADLRKMIRPFAGVA